MPISMKLVAIDIIQSIPYIYFLVTRKTSQFTIVVLFLSSSWYDFFYYMLRWLRIWPWPINTLAAIQASRSLIVLASFWRCLVILVPTVVRETSVRNTYDHVQKVAGFGFLHASPTYTHTILILHNRTTRETGSNLKNEAINWKRCSSTSTCILFHYNRKLRISKETTPFLSVTRKRNNEKKGLE
jgi:hypothetical protein